MGKRFQNSLIIVILIGMIFCLASCEDPADKNPSGIYEAIECKDVNGEEYEIEDELLCIEEDGGGYFFLNETKYQIVWTLKNGNFSFEDSTGDSFNGTYSKGIIEGVYFDGFHYVFSRKQ